ncbi:MAG: translation initiation factor IF-3 [bacterium]
MKDKRLFINKNIRAERIRLISQDGNQKGVVSKKEALEEARKANLDLVEIAHDNSISVCKIMDYGKYMYCQNKKAKEGKKKQKIIQIKEIKLRPSTDDHDFAFKVNQSKKFLENGQKIKVVLNFKGREIVHSEIGMDTITRFSNCLKDFSFIERRPYFEGKRIVMVIAPVKSQKTKK